MRSIEIIALGIRLLGIFFLIKSVQHFGSTVSAYKQVQSITTDESAHSVIFGYLISSVILLLSSIVFIKFPVTVSKMLLPRSTGEGPILKGNENDFQMALFIFLGVYILSWSIPDLLFNSAMLYVVNTQNGYSSVDFSETVVALIVTVIEMGIGAYLALNSNGLIRLIKNLRS